MNYSKIRDDIAIAIATAKFPYNSIGVIIENKTINRIDYWRSLNDSQQKECLLQAQAAMSIMASIGYDIVINLAFQQYVSEK